MSEVVCVPEAECPYRVAKAGLVGSRIKVQSCIRFDERRCIREGPRRYVHAGEEEITARDTVAHRALYHEAVLSISDSYP